ncbi:MAG TPA: carboxypeptidase-like regulatory domain-containing protein, partial [Pyrinomonadaceae bacterium]|nr:carboxypeptidase-like regulatory domain-containing protein [Pyrinomonadaceae bacterium]
DTVGFNFWLTKLNDFGGNYIAAEMVRAFIESTEVRQRFGANFGSLQSFSEGETTQINADVDLPPVMDPPQRPRIPQTPIIGLDPQPLVPLFTSSSVSISGHVFDPAGTRLKAAMVALTGGDLKRSTTTNVSGDYYFDNLPAGDYTLTVSSKKYTFTSKTVAAPNDLKDVDLAAKP